MNNYKNTKANRHIILHFSFNGYDTRLGASFGYLWNSLAFFQNGIVQKTNPRKYKQN